MNELYFPDKFNGDEEETRDHDISSFNRFLETKTFEEVEKERQERFKKERIEIRKKIPKLIEERLKNVLFRENTYHHFQEALIPVENSKRMKKLTDEIKTDKIIDKEGKLDMQKWKELCEREEFPLLSSIYNLDEICKMLLKEEINGTLFSYSYSMARPHCFIVTSDGYLLCGMIAREYLAVKENPKNVSTLDVYDYFKSLQEFIKRNS